MCISRGERNFLSFWTAPTKRNDRSTLRPRSERRRLSRALLLVRHLSLPVVHDVPRPTAEERALAVRVPYPRQGDLLRVPDFAVQQVRKGTELQQLPAMRGRRPWRDEISAAPNQGSHPSRLATVSNLSIGNSFARKMTRTSTRKNPAAISFGVRRKSPQWVGIVRGPQITGHHRLKCSLGMINLLSRYKAIFIAWKRVIHAFLSFYCIVKNWSVLLRPKGEIKWWTDGAKFPQQIYHTTQTSIIKLGKWKKYYTVIHLN